MTTVDEQSSSVFIDHATSEEHLDRAAADRRDERVTVTYGEFQRWCREGPERSAILAADDYQARLTAYLDEVFQPDVTRLVTIDVFDTVLVRRPISELHRFARIAATQAEALPSRFGIKPTALDLLVARLQATHASYRMSEPVNGSREGSITQIYGVVETLLGLKERTREQLIELELDYEATVLQPNRALEQWVGKVAGLGTEIVLLSDMYLHSDHIRRLLEAAGILSDQPLISSADEKVTKHSGTAYTRLIENADVRPEEIMHIGDNLRSDYQMARRAGIRSAYLPVPTAELEVLRQDHETTLTAILGQGHDLSRWIRHA